MRSLSRLRLPHPHLNNATFCSQSAFQPRHRVFLHLKRPNPPNKPNEKGDALLHISSCTPPDPENHAIFKAVVSLPRSTQSRSSRLRKDSARNYLDLDLDLER